MGSFGNVVAKESGIMWYPSGGRVVDLGRGIGAPEDVGAW